MTSALYNRDYKATAGLQPGALESMQAFQNLAQTSNMNIAPNMATPGMQQMLQSGAVPGVTNPSELVIPQAQPGSMLATGMNANTATAPNLFSKTATGFKNIFGFTGEKPTLATIDTNSTPGEIEAAKVNNNAIAVSAQQSLAKWNAVGNVIGGITGVGNMYLGFEQLDIAKDQAKLAKQAYRTNLANQTKTYNTQLAERRTAALRADGIYSEDALKSYMDKHGI